MHPCMHLSEPCVSVARGCAAGRYAGFLEQLFDAITMRVPVVDEATGELVMVTYVWKAEADCAFDSAYADDENRSGLSRGAYR